MGNKVLSTTYLGMYIHVVLVGSTARYIRCRFHNLGNYIATYVITYLRLVYLKVHFQCSMSKCWLTYGMGS